MQDWWKSLTPKQQLALIVAIMGAIGGISVAPSITIDTGKNTTTTITNNADKHSGSGDIVKGNKIIYGDNVAGNKIINIGLTLEEHEQRLESREVEIRAELNKSPTDDRHLLQTELQAIEKALHDSKSSYEALVSSLKARIAQLEAQRGDWPDDVLDKAIEALQKGDVKTADDLFQKVEQDSEKHIKRAAEAAYQRGKIAEDQIRYADSLQHYENAVRLQPGNTLYLNDAGTMHQGLANYEKAIEYYELALASDLKTYGENHPKVAIYRNNLGLAWASLGEYPKAIEYYELALASALKTYGENHPDVAIDRNNLGLAWASLGEYQKAIEYLELALASDLKIFGENHPQVALYRNNLGAAWKSLGDYHKAIEYYQSALASDLKTYGENHPQVATYRNNLGLAWYSLGDYQKAIEYYELALASNLKTYGENHPQVALYRNNLGLVWESMGEYQKAIEYLELALASDLKIFGENHPQVALY